MKSGFAGIVQTGFNRLSEINEIQCFEKGYVKGGFVVIHAIKNSKNGNFN